MSDKSNLMEKVSALSERLKMSGSEVGSKISAGMSSISFKMKELFQSPNQTDKIVEEATSETLQEPDWSTNLEICDLVNQDRLSSIDLVRSIKKRIMFKNPPSPRVPFLALLLLETLLKNCDKAFSDVASERVLDEIVKLIDDPQTVVLTRNKALMLIESWGESSSDLRFLPVFEQTYKSLKSRGIRFPGRDDESLSPIFTPPRSVSETPSAPHHHTPVLSFSAHDTKEAFDVARNCVDLLSTVLSSSPQQDALQDDLTSTLVLQCRQSQSTILSIIDTAGDNEALLFEALCVNDEIQKALTKYQDLKKPSAMVSAPEPAMIPVAVEPEESPRGGKEEPLIRKPSGGRGTSVGGQHDDMMDDLDEMIFGKKSASGSEAGVVPKKPDAAKDDLISF